MEITMARLQFMGVQKGTFDPYQGKHDPVFARNLKPDEIVPSCGFGALIAQGSRPMRGKVYVTAIRLGFVTDQGQPWAIEWAEMHSLDVKTGLLGGTAWVDSKTYGRWGVDSTKAILRDIGNTWANIH